MKLKQRMISLLVAILLIFGSIPVGHATLGELTLNGRIEDAITDMAYGWDGLTYRFPAGLLNGVEEGHDVYLVADTKVEGFSAEMGFPNAGTDIAVMFTNFRLAGEHAELYIVPTLTEGLKIEESINILPKTIRIRPAVTQAYYGQDLPENGRVSVNEDYRTQLVSENEDVTISCTFTFSLDGAPEVGEYALDKVGKIRMVGADSANYEAVVENEEDLVFNIVPYEPDVTASDRDAGGIQNGKDKAMLDAPEGFLISKTGSLTGEGWGASIEIDLEESMDADQKNTVEYYLRNNNPGTEEYKAICKKTYTYSFIPMPTVTGIEIAAGTWVETNGDVIPTTMLFKRDGVYANGKVLVTVYVRGASFEQETEVFLSVGGVETTPLTVEAVLEDGKYNYKAVFEINAVDGESVIHELKAYAKTTSGTSDKYPAEDCRDTYLNSITPVTEPLVLDRKAPDVQINEIETVRKNVIFFSYPEKLVGTFTVSDMHCGVAKVEYRWDNQEYREYKGQNKDPYRVEMSWSNGIHTLYVRVTDELGNVMEYSRSQGRRDDYMPPIIDSVLVEGVEDTAKGLLAKDNVRIIVKAHDDDSDANSGVSGIQRVVVVGKILNESGTKYRDYSAEAKLDANTGAYVLSIAPNVELIEVEVQAWDSFGHTPQALNKIPMQKDAPAEGEEGSTEVSYYQSANIYIDNTKPNIAYVPGNRGITYDGGASYWFGQKDNSEKLVFSFTDGPDSVTAGLKYILVTDTFTAEDGTQKTLNRVEKTVQVLGVDKEQVEIGLEKLEQGKHTMTVTVKDYCGNQNEMTFTFTKDTVEPQSGDIYLKEADQDSKNVKTLGTEQWFAPVIDPDSNRDGYISFRIGTTKGEEMLSKMIVVVNGFERTYSFNEAKGWYYDESGSYIYVDTANFIMNQHNKAVPANPPTDAIPYNHYVIHATLVDMAGNTSERDEIVYVDKVSPVIDRVTVQKAEESVVDQIIRILTFGIFSNDDLIFRVYTKDGAGDSGMSRVSMTVKDNDTAETKAMDMTDEGVDADGFTVYSYTVSKGDLKKFDGSLAFTAFDRYGKDWSKYPFIDVNENYEVMIERELPTITFELPENRGPFADERKDGQIWYNTDQPLSLQVHDTHSGIYTITLLVNGHRVNLFSNPTGIVADMLFTPNKEADAEINSFDQFFTLFNLERAVNENAVAGKNGEYRIAIKVADNSGNVYADEWLYHVDTVNPQIDSISFSREAAGGISETTEVFEVPQNVEYGYFFAENFDLTVHVSDAAPSSGCYIVRYWLNSLDGAPTEVEVVDGKALVDVPDNFKGQIFYEVLDYAGNSSGVLTTKAFVVDQAAPTIQITKNKTTNYRDAEGNPLYTEANSFTVVITDMVSGLKEFGYTKSAELSPAEKKTVTVASNVQMLGDGWEIIGRDANLVTKVTKTFAFPENDNDVCMHFDAMDQALRKSSIVDSETFTIDTIAPVIVVDFGPDNDDDPYYNQNRVAQITVTERNFDEKLINVLIQNTFGSVPGYTFTHNAGDKTKHTTTINFDEGDYTFDLTGKDLGGHSAVVTFTGGNEKLFYVDKTVPMISENFWEFANSNENSFNADMTAQIKIVEHNFDARLTNLRITRKAAGGEHSHNGMVDVTEEVLGGRGWSKSGDAYTIEFTFSTDAVYYVEIAPMDLASNQGAKHNTVIFEIDKTVPVVSAKNGKAVSPDDTEQLDIYPYDRRDSAAPTVEFSDNNIACIEYTLITYIPEYLSNGMIRVESAIERGIVEGNLFTLNDFDRDGIYAVELVAVDVAGNRSEVNFNTYARMVKQDVLAFILDSNVTEQTGLFSLEYENGESISKKPYDFKDLRILVMTPEETPIDIVLRDTNGKEILAESNLASVESVYGVNVHTFEIGAHFFQENFQDDIDTEMHLTVRNQGNRIDLARIHIDNIAPDCDFPPELRSWARFHGEEDRTFTITNISELLELEDCKVYDNGEEIPFEYSSEKDTITFTLSKGWHNIGFILCDAAGNANISQEMNNIHIGNFWIIFDVTLGVLAVTILVALILDKRRRTVQEMLEEE